jgi:XTP/dITP diphosphohydrolase
MLDSVGTPIVMFATSNTQKFKEVKMLFDNRNISLRHLQIDIVEIQSTSLEDIAIAALKSCFEIYNHNLIFVEDSGLFIRRLKNFPGPYSSYVYKTIGLKGILKLMKDVVDRTAYFQATIALKTEEEIKVFTGIVEGQISYSISDFGWGYDPIFIPDNHGSLTYGELGLKKRFISHRFLAAIKLIEFLKKSIFKVI